MPLGEKKIRGLTAAGLVLATLATRLPFASKMLFEFDSVDFAVATFRYSLEQVTPHFPGYILHILFTRFLLLFTTDVNQAMVWVSIVLSIGSVLYLWRAAAVLRGERVALIAALIWLLLPIFWFYGLVATTYEYEAFFACVFLYHGFKLIRSPSSVGHIITLFVWLSLATGARQSSFIFLAPALIFLLIYTRPRLIVVGIGILLFTSITIGWLSILNSFTHSQELYLPALASEKIIRSQSILFGNDVNQHLAIIAKILIYLIGSALPLLAVFLFAALRYPKRFFAFIKSTRKSITLRYASLIPIPPFIFYIVIYFMKGGYLLNILPVVALAAAVIIDQVAIWRAYDIKTQPQNRLLLTRPIITKACIVITSIVLLIETFWFIAPFPSASARMFHDGLTRDSFSGRSDKSPRTLTYIFNRILSFTSLHSVLENDRAISIINDTVHRELAKHPDLYLLDTWWHRWAYYYAPAATTYDIRPGSIDHTLAVGLSGVYRRKNWNDAILYIHPEAEVLLLMRKDHPDFESISKQVALERLDLPEHLEVWRIVPKEFTFVWGDRRFVKPGVSQ